MNWISLKRDRQPGFVGLLGALAGPLIAALLVTVLGVIVFEGFPSMSVIVLLFGINAIMVVGYQLFVGSTGIVSFGHVAFMGLGAYAGGIAAIPVVEKGIVLPDLPGFLSGLELSILPATIFGGLVAAFAALLVGFPLMRLTGAAASIATLGLLVITNNVLDQSTSLTKGPQSIFGIPETTTLFWVFTILIASVLISALFKWSRAGLRARAARDDPIAAESSGVPLLRARLWAFVLSAFLTGMGGALYAQLLTAFSPASFYVPQIVVVLAMAIIGGINSITGALLGATVITVLNELMRRVESGTSVAGVHLHAPVGISAAVLGAVLIVMLRWRPEGLLGAGELQPSGRRESTPPSWVGHGLAADPPESESRRET